MARNADPGKSESRAGKTGAMKRYPRFAVPLFVLAVFGCALWLLDQELKEYHLRDVVASFAQIPTAHLALAGLLTALNYAILVGYDLIATRQIGHRLPLHRVAFASFAGYVSAYNFGSLLGATTVRYRLYSSWGLSTIEIVKLVAMLTVSFWVGLAAFAGVVFLIEPLPIPAALHLPFSTGRPAGFVLLFGVGSYLLLGAVRRRPAKILGWELTPLSTRVSVAQIAVASADLAVAAAVLYVLLPASVIVSYPQFLGVFLLAIVAAIFSNVPGGLGVFELVILSLLAPKDPHWVLGALLAFRGIYYLIPLGIAALALGGYEFFLRGRQMRQAATVVGKTASAVVPSFFALLTFTAGAVLLISGATPTAHERLGWIRFTVPLPVMEVSHFLGSVIGAGLLLLARGLQRRLDTAYWLTMVLLCAGTLFSLLKGVDYEEAAVLFVMFLAFAPARRNFYRKGSLLGQPPEPAWIAAAVLVIACSVWIGLFSYKHVDYSHDLWWHFSFRGDAPRFLRATAGIITLLLIVAIAYFLQPARPQLVAVTDDDMRAAARIAGQSPATYANLALLGDKHFLFNHERSAFIMYGVARRSWVALGDPVGSLEARPELLWRYRELCDQYDGRTVFYQVSEESMPHYLDLGLSFVKLGEEARVPLTDFSLAGSARKPLRQTSNRFHREDCSFEILDVAAVRNRMAELRAVSDAWMAQKNTSEKGFSLGSFLPDYIQRFPVAIVHREGIILAFTNLWLGSGKQELSIDLMRYVQEAPFGVMDYLFTELMLWGRDEGYQWFNLGMAPLAGLENRSLAPLWHRFGNLVFRHGEHFYNFQGLRHYKEKFEPDWRPRYLASPGGFALPQILGDIATLTSGGVRRLVTK